MKPKKHTLKNGMTALLVPQAGATSMTLMVFAKVGSRYETKPINGVSHFVEHLMFKGTKKRPDTLTISKELDRYGAEYNAFTSKDMTAYYIKIDAKRTNLAVDILHDMLSASLYDTKEIDRERGVIIEEINMYEDNPRMHIEDLLEGVLFPGNTLGWNIAGPREVIKRVSRQEIINYRDRYYIPSRMTVVVAGKQAPGILALLNKTFGAIQQPRPKHDRPFTPFHAPKNLKQALAFQSKNTEQVQLALAFHGLPFGDKRLPAASLLATLLGGNMSSRLFIQVRERRGLCYSIHASHQALEDTGVFSIMSGLKKTAVGEASQVILDELKQMIKEKISQEELQRAKDYLRGKLVLAFEDSSSQADWYGKMWLFEHAVVTPEERLQQIDRVTPEDIQTVAKLIFRKQNMASAVIGPFKNAKQVKQLIPSNVF
ncbi:insulinase family protein [Candidatus Uhrbacteria bacterium]|nr:insulinase family protein [Candidatus Uhrbacteria bacterium]